MESLIKCGALTHWRYASAALDRFEEAVEWATAKLLAEEIAQLGCLAPVMG
jgi:hypothetical protein